ncbi:MAG: cyclic nucleotide-binding domain-containing protein [Deltaproteobacteria bacterium]|nr:cyclic nucleotide-binding domain-containing protein [Deltaproteobacteria bacterium]
MKESDFLDENAVIVERLKQLPILRTFDKDDIKGLMQFSKVREYDVDEVIIREGDTDTCIFFILSGKVIVEKDGVELAELGQPGDVFGEMAVIQSRPRSATVRAFDKTLCLMVDSSYMDMLDKTDKSTFMYIIFRIFSILLANRLRETTDSLIAAKREIDRLKEGSP